MSAQSLHALTVANARRTERMRVKAAIKAGRVSAGDVLLNPPECLLSMPLFELLEATPNVGRPKLQRLNMLAAREGINLFRPLGKQSVRSRLWLLDNVRPLKVGRLPSAEREAA